MKSLSEPKAPNRYPDVRRELIETLEFLGVDGGHRRVILSFFELGYSAGKCDGADEIVKDMGIKRTYEPEVFSHG